MQYIQDKGILHRDLKFENILIDKDYRIKIADFGLAKMVEEQYTHTTCGSTHIMAPEVMKKLPYGKESDIWSLGVLLYGMISGQESLFTKVNRPEYESKIMKFVKVEYPKDVQVSEKARDIISRMLTPEPKDRITIDKILEHPWIVDSLTESDLMCSNIYLRTYLNSGKASEKLHTHFKKHIDRSISSHLIEHVNLTMARVNNLASRLEENQHSSISSEAVNII